MPSTASTPHGATTFESGSPAINRRESKNICVPPELGPTSSGRRPGGVRKPAVEFFARIVDTADLPAEAILYVGDRLDNDVVPAHRAGMRTAHLRRGPWGYLHARRPERSVADIRVDSLAELATLWSSGA